MQRLTESLLRGSNKTIFMHASASTSNHNKFPRTLMNDIFSTIVFQTEKPTCKVYITKLQCLFVFSEQGALRGKASMRKMY